MSQRVRVNPFPSESIYPLGTRIDVLCEQIPNSEPGEFGTPSVHEQPCVTCFIAWSTLGEFAKLGCGLWSNRT
jgi:hypothetical protein